MSDMLFSVFCEYCEKISHSTKDKKGLYLKKFITDYCRQTNKSFHCVLRLLLPQLDRERSAYGIKEHTLAKIYIRILCLHKQSKDAQSLLNFRSPKNAGTSAGDFGDVAYWVLKNRCSEGKELTVAQVNTHLDNIALKHAEHDPRGVDEELEIMLQRMSAKEQKWLIRIILKDMKLRMGHSRVLGVFHPDAKEVYDVSNSLVKICEKLKDPSIRLHEIEITLFEPFRPMLAERCDVQNVEKYFVRNPGKRFVETKLDGERMQLHFSNGEFKYFSRNGYSYTDDFGSDARCGSVSPYLAKQLKPEVKSCILDGEMMPWNTKYKKFGNKGMNIDVKSLRVGNIHQPCYCVFDIVYCNGKVLTNKPLSERLTTLKTVFTTCEGIIMHTTRKTVNSSQEVMEALNEAIDNQEEGLVVKDPNSIYKPNARKEGWIKIKPEYTDGAMVELDLLIIGGYYGEGRKRGIVSHFLLGIAVPPDNPGSDPKEFESVTRVGSGCTMDELEELGEKLKPFWQRLRTGDQPPGLKWTKEKPELWIKPSDSFILQVKASEIVSSDAYQAEHTLRFPRIERVRYDKPWRNCMTTTEFSDLRKEANGKLFGSHIFETNTKTKKRRLAKIAPSVGEHFLTQDLSRVKKLTKIFSDKDVCVLTGSRDVSKKQLEIKIHENGGNIVQNPVQGVFCVVAGDRNNVRVRNVSFQGKYDLVTVEWLLKCIESCDLVPWTPNDLISMSPDTSKQIALLYDSYGDSFTQPSTLDSLENCLKNVQEMGDIQKLTADQLLSMDEELFNGPSPFAIFRGCTAYFDVHCEVNDTYRTKVSGLNIAAIDFKFQGGTAESTISDKVTHVVLHSEHLQNLPQICVQLNSLRNNLFIVSHKWILDSWLKRKRLSEEDYVL